MKRKIMLSSLTLVLCLTIIILWLSFSSRSEMMLESKLDNASIYPPPEDNPQEIDSYPPPGEDDTSVRSETGNLSPAAQIALNYIANREEIPLENLDVKIDRTVTFPEISRTFQAVAILETGVKNGGQVFKLHVDLLDGSIIEDLNEIRNLEAQASQRKYGKLQPTLYERLQGIEDDEILPVAIWAKSSPGETAVDIQEAAYAALAEKYPEARASMENMGKPMDVQDPELASQIGKTTSPCSKKWSTSVRPLWWPN